MDVRCIMCGKKEELNTGHNDYRKIQENPKAVYICTLCSARTFFEATEGQKPIKPI